MLTGYVFVLLGFLTMLLLWKEDTPVWTVALGSGYRGTINQLDPDARERVRSRVVSGLRNQMVADIETNIIYAVASKR